MKIVKLLQKQPLMYFNNPTFYEVGDKFEVVDEKEMEIVGKCYKLKYAGCIFDGWIVAKNFEEL